MGDEAARRREMRLASLHVRGIHDEHSHRNGAGQRPVWEDEEIANYVNWFNCISKYRPTLHLAA